MTSTIWFVACLIMALYWLREGFLSMFAASLMLGFMWLAISR